MVFMCSNNDYDDNDFSGDLTKLIRMKINKKWLFFLLVLLVWVTQFNHLEAKTIELSANPTIDYSFTKNYQLTYNSKSFMLDRITVTPKMYYQNSN
jgi:hypothetical protein